MDNEIIINKKNTKTITVTYTQDSSAYDLTDKRVVLTVKENASDTDSEAVIQKTFTTGDTTGIATFNLSSDDTDITEGVYSYDVTLVTSGKGTVLSTQKGAIKVRESVTQDIPSF